MRWAIRGRDLTMTSYVRFILDIRNVVVGHNGVKNPFCLPLRAQRQSPILSVSSFAVRDSTVRQVSQATVPLGHL